MTKFAQDVILTVLDGLVIGVLVAFAGFVLNRLLERYKAKEAFTREIMRVRVDKMGEIWSALYEWAWLNDEWMSKIGEAKTVESGLKEPEEFAFTPDRLKEQATTQNQEAQKRRDDIE